jgi:aminoglycoside 6'-N-acetyltransferase I
MIVIRLLQDHDYPEWLRLRATIWPHETQAELEAEMAEILANPDTMPVFVAERPEGSLCGFLDVSLHDKAPGCTTDKIGYLEGWYVDPDYRQQGIGRRLVEAGEAWARAQGCTEMASDTNEWYPLSPTAHARLGYEIVERAIYFRKALLSG